MALGDQLPYLGTSLLVGLGTVALTLVVAAPAGLRTGPPAATGAPRRSASSLLVAQMVPGGRHVAGPLPGLHQPRAARHPAGTRSWPTPPSPCPFAVLLFTRVHARHPARAARRPRRSTARRTGGPSVSIVLPISRNAAVTVALFAFLWAWSDFIFASTLDRGGGDRSRSRSASTTTSATTTRSGTRSWPPPSSPRSRRSAPHRARPALRRRRRHRRRSQGLTRRPSPAPSRPVRATLRRAATGASSTCARSPSPSAGSVARTSRRSSRLHTVADRPPPRLAPDRHARRAAVRARARRRAGRRPTWRRRPTALEWLDRDGGRDRARPSRRPTPCGCAARGSACALIAAAAT